MSKPLAHNLEAKWRSDDVITNEGRDFSTFHLDERILTGLTDAGYKIPSPVQLEAIPLCLTGSDVFVQGKAGTGKTLVFSILALTAVLEAEDLEVLIVAPSREGAFQIYNTIRTIGSKVNDLKCEYFIGGFNYAEDIPKACQCKIAVGTPGRILHLIKDEKLNVDTIQLFIIDDFDELLNRHSKPEVSDIFHFLPEKKQTVVASLTCTDEVMNLTSEFLKHPFLTCFNESELSLLGMTHYYYIVPVNSLPSLVYRKKLEVLKKVLFKAKFLQCVIFCNSVHWVEPLCIDIQMWGISVVSLSKAKDQVERFKAVELLKKNKCKVFVTTDVSSRGLDAENVDLVINFDLPIDCRVYLHRCGRAGRYGAKCSSITFLLKNQTDQFDEIEYAGRFDSYALPEPIPKDLHCGLMGKFQTSSTEFNKNTIFNLDTAAGEGCSFSTKENGEIDLENVDESYPVAANKIEEQTINLETINISQHLKKRVTGNESSSFEGKDLCSASKTVPKSSLKIKSNSKMSENHPLHEAFNRMHLGREENCNKMVTKIPQVTRNKKKSSETIGNICNKKCVKSLDHYQSKSGRQVMFCGLKKTSSEFDANRSCTTFCSGYPAHHIDKKKVNNRKMHSTCGMHLDRCDCFSQTCKFNVQKRPRSCHASSQHCCHFPDFVQPPFILPRDDMFYNQWMFINNYSYFLSHYFK